MESPAKWSPCRLQLIGAITTAAGQRKPKTFSLSANNSSSRSILQSAKRKSLLVSCCTAFPDHQKTKIHSRTAWHFRPIWKSLGAKDSCVVQIISFAESPARKSLVESVNSNQLIHTEIGPTIIRPNRSLSASYAAARCPTANGFVKTDARCIESFVCFWHLSRPAVNIHRALRLRAASLSAMPNRYLFFGKNLSRN